MQLLRAILGLAPIFSACHGLVIEKDNLHARDSDGKRPERARLVKEAFQFAWHGYYKYAYPNDELLPLTNGSSNTRNGWGASAVDALSTALVMKEKTIVNQILAHIPEINYKKSIDNNSVSLFETTIRYIGGMLSGYDFLTGPLAYLAEDKSQVKALLTQSQILANQLSFAFQTGSGVPHNDIYFNNRTFLGAPEANLAQAGSLVLEWTHLSDLTGNRAYARKAQKGESYLLNPLPKSKEPYPGLVGTTISTTTGKFLNDQGGWVGGDDSFYEYLIKMYIYDPSRFGVYKDRWLLAVESSMKYLASHPSSRPDLTYLAYFDDHKNENISEHLACFDGGNFILGGSVLDRPDIANFGLKLVKACRNTYTSTLTNIGPEIFSWNVSAITPEQEPFYNKHGFYITNAEYVLRPEVMESYYYAYQYTRDPMYQDWAWDAFLAINSTCRHGSGFVELSDVNAPGGGDLINFQESFLYAELMKYSFLVQSAEEPWDVIPKKGGNQWVFNTEGHPFRVNGKPI